ncbi:hypothetical protein [Caballeronia sp. Lep1P3]|uniref:hypothetical protein n=1 Tax=Caballeronia sp. Lep1P3 TaxID=2878150 RepID=UPI001FD58843|nr:hypothetical protein [Caballeronia sp. Lep1P3]
MPHHAELPEEPFADALSPANDPSVPVGPPDPLLDYDDDAGSVRAPLRFGRLALWMASASALGIGVLGTVAYSMWFNHDQRVYAEAMTSARRSLGIDEPVIGSAQPSQTLSSGVVEAPTTTAVTAQAARADTTTLADNPPADAPDTMRLGPVAGAQAADAPPDAAAQARARSQQVAASRPGRSSPAAQPVRTAQNAQAARRRAARGKAEPGLFARVGAFFHRVSYRRNATSGQRDEYSRP